MNYVWDFAILTKYSHLFWAGLGWTMAYTVGTILLGSLIGSSSASFACGVIP
jgi:polar amino acid transport system permease protein